MTNLIEQYHLYIIASLIIVLLVFLSIYILFRTTRKYVRECKILDKHLIQKKTELDNYKNNLNVIKDELVSSEIKLKENNDKLVYLDSQTKDLIQIKYDEEKIRREILETNEKLETINRSMDNKIIELNKLDSHLKQVYSDWEFYSSLVEDYEIGISPEPLYSFGYSKPHKNEIKSIRDQQKKLIQNENAVIFTGKAILSSYKTDHNRLIYSQKKLMLTAFNFYCEQVLGQMTVKNYPNTLEKIEKYAAKIEKYSFSLFCGFTIEYVKLKYLECKIHYEWLLKYEKDKDIKKMPSNSKLKQNLQKNTSNAYKSTHNIDEITILVNYVKSLSDFTIYKDIGGQYQNMGAIIIDGILQAGVNYKTTVKPRVNNFLQKYPKIQTTRQFKKVCDEITVPVLINWTKSQKTERIEKLTDFLIKEGVDTDSEFKEWLKSDSNIIKIKGLSGIKDKTADYFKILTGHNTNAIDRHLIRFLKKAGISISEYQEAHNIISGAASILGIKEDIFDHSIWKYMSGFNRN